MHGVSKIQAPGERYITATFAAKATRDSEAKPIREAASRISRLLSSVGASSEYYQYLRIIEDAALAPILAAYNEAVAPSQKEYADSVAVTKQEIKETCQTPEPNWPVKSLGM